MSNNQRMYRNRSEVARIVEFVASQRAMVLSKREWKHRLAGFGFSIEESDNGPVIATLPRRKVVCLLPPELCA
jgi:hypothetical protein